MQVRDRMAVIPMILGAWGLSLLGTADAAVADGLAVSTTTPGRIEPGPDTGGAFNHSSSDLAWGIGGPVMIGIGIILLIVWFTRRGRAPWEKQQHQG